MVKKTSVRLGNALDIMHAAQLKTRLETCLAKNKPVVLISDKVERADTAGLQLIYAFIQAVESAGHSVSWQKPSDPLRQIAETLGMEQHLNLQEQQ